MNKQCKECFQYKPYTDFHKNKTNKDGLGSYCKPCSNKKARDHYYSRTYSIYAILENDKIIKIGTSKMVLSTRLKEYAIKAFENKQTKSPFYKWVQQRFKDFNEAYEYLIQNSQILHKFKRGATKQEIKEKQHELIKYFKPRLNEHYSEEWVHHKMNKQRCCTCDEIKPFDDFSKSKNFKSGYKTECKLCSAKRTKKYYKKNRERAIAAVRKSQQKKKESN